MVFVKCNNVILIWIKDVFTWCKSATKWSIYIASCCNASLKVV